MKNNESGMVLVTVTLVIITMAIFVTVLLNHGLSQTTATQSQVDSIKADVLAYGIAAKAYSDRATGAALDSSISTTLNGKPYDFDISSAGSTITISGSY